ncbi:monovalent cation/H(+) antiporter subunit G [Enterovirga rhinocerotis]|uniref:Multisubunit potassium/proton antiporter PhaG subunit n=1 Tax=Enterovirga rhinocerotis TaxID=1339210 RepID=A0A4R7BZR0_9HYPH|nr:monovalent cation/H(+) antiporter subunit G [Enterovirga rhinocerotis]TDR89596.1 multisubunit potassium/proton antiporter PhaG subunit [Enterovirga rhinocerotis]
MNGLQTLPAWAEILVAILVVLGSGLALIGSIGLVRFRSFYERVHAPTLGSTLGTASILLASIAFFSLTRTRPFVHELLIGLFVTVTTPVTLLMLVQATIYRDRLEGRDPLARREDES